LLEGTHKVENPICPDLHDPSDILWGAEAIGREVNIVDENGDVDLRRVYHKLNQQHLPAKKVGRVWISSRRQLRQVTRVTA
jgi:hypothetical protein